MVIRRTVGPGHSASTRASWFALALGVLSFIAAAALVVPSLLRARNYIVTSPPTPYWEQFQMLITDVIDPRRRHGLQSVVPTGDLKWLFHGIAILAGEAIIVGVFALLRRSGGWRAWTGIGVAGVTLAVYLALSLWFRSGPYHPGF